MIEKQGRKEMGNILCDIKMKQIETIFDVIDEKIIVGEYEEVDEMFVDFPYEDYSMKDLIGFLSATNRVKERFKNRINFLNGVEKKMQDELRDDERIKQVLNGLK